MVNAEASDRWWLRRWAVWLLTWLRRCGGLVPGCGVQPYGLSQPLVTPVFVRNEAFADRCTHKLLKCFSQNRENSSNSRWCGWCGRSSSGPAQLAWRAGDAAGAPAGSRHRQWGRAAVARICPPVVPSAPHSCPHDVHARDLLRCAMGDGVAAPAWRNTARVVRRGVGRSPSANGPAFLVPGESWLHHRNNGQAVAPGWVSGTDARTVVPRTSGDRSARWCRAQRRERSRMRADSSCTWS